MKQAGDYTGLGILWALKGYSKLIRSVVSGLLHGLLLSDKLASFMPNSGYLFCFNGGMRSTDTNPTKRYFRSSARIFKMNGAWFFSTREGERGPFRSPEQAQAGLAQYVHDVEQLREFQDSRRDKARARSARLRDRRHALLDEQAGPPIELTLEPL